jgi:hypothetical protein
MEIDLDPEARRIRGYLVAQGGKLGLPELVDKLRRDAAPLREAAGRVPAGRFHEPPEAGEWSAAQVFTHVLEMTVHGHAAVDAIVTGERPPPGVRDAVSGVVWGDLRTAEDYWRTFEELREPFYASVLRARGDEHLDVTLPHPTFGPLNWREWLLFMRIHDQAHIRQIEDIAARFS